MIIPLLVYDVSWVIIYADLWFSDDEISVPYQSKTMIRTVCFILFIVGIVGKVRMAHPRAY